MKRLLPLLLALVLVITAAVPAYATGDGNFDGGGGSMGDGTKTNYWNPGMDGVRVSIVDVGSHSVVRTPFDLTNKVPIANIVHFGKVSKLSYNAGRGLSVFFVAKLGTAYFDFRKSGQFEWTAPAILFACLVFTLTAPLYIWQIIGI